MTDSGSPKPKSPLATLIKAAVAIGCLTAAGVITYVNFVPGASITPGGAPSSANRHAAAPPVRQQPQRVPTASRSRTPQAGGSTGLPQLDEAAVMQWSSRDAKIGVLPATDDESSDAFARLVEQELLADGQLNLVDRSAIETTLSELELQRLLSGASFESRRESMTLLDAAFLVLVSAPDDARVVDADRRLRASVVFTPLGMRTAMLESDKADVQAASADLAQQVRDHLKRDRTSGKLVALPPVIDGRLVPSEDQLALKLREALERDLAADGLLLIELSEAQKLEREMQIRGDAALGTLGSPWMLHTRIQADLVRPDDLTIVAVLRHGGQAAMEYQSKQRDAARVAEQLASRVAETMAQPDRPAARRDTAALLARARETHKAGQLEESLDLIETFLLYEPEHLEARGVAVRLAYELVTRESEAFVKRPSDERAATISDLYVRGCRHADAFMEIATPRDLYDRRYTRGRHPLKPIEFYDQALLQLFGGDELVGFPEPLAAEMIDAHHRTLRRHIWRRIAALDSGVSPATLKSFGLTWAHMRRDPHLLDERIALWAQMQRVQPGDWMSVVPFHAGRERGSFVQRGFLDAVARNIPKFANQPHLALQLDQAARNLEMRINLAQSRRLAPGLSQPKLWASEWERYAFAAAEAAAPPADPVADYAAKLDKNPLVFQTLTSPPDRAGDAAGDRAAQPAWHGVRPCGEHGDLLWHGAEISLLRPDRSRVVLVRLAQNVLKAHGAEGRFFHEPVFDGQHVWAVLPCKETLLLRINPTTGEVTRFSTENGLPPSQGGATVVAAEPGKVLIAGSIGDQLSARTWVVLANAEGDRLELESLYEAQSVFKEEHGKPRRAGRVGFGRIFEDRGNPERKVAYFEIGVGWESRADQIDGFHTDVPGALVIDLATHQVRTVRWVRALGSLHRWTALPDRIFRPDIGVAFFPATGEQRQVTLQSGTAPGGMGHYSSMRGAYNQGWCLGIWAGRLWGGPVDDEPIRLLSTVAIKRTDGQLSRSIARHTVLYHSDHQGLIMVDPEGRAAVAPLPTDLEARFEAAPPPVPEERQLRQWAGHQWMGPGPMAVVTLVTQSEARRLARTYRSELPTDLALLRTVPVEKVRRWGIWTDWMTNKSGRLTEADLLPPGTAGKYGVLWTGALVARPKNATGHLRIPYGRQEALGIAPFVAPSVRLLPPGRRTIGSVSGAGVGSSLEPHQQVTVPRGLYLAETETTELQWMRVMEPQQMKKLSSDSALRLSRIPKRVHPHEVKPYLDRLSARTGQTWRLPTEEEWEYACRAGSTTAYANGDTVEDLKRIGWASYDGFTASAGGFNFVKTREPNAWGFYDLHGNVRELTSSVVGPRDLISHPVETKLGPGEHYIQRGGNWLEGPEDCRSASRTIHVGWETGFRVLLDCSEAPDQAPAWAREGVAALPALAGFEIQQPVSPAGTGPLDGGVPQEDVLGVTQEQWEAYDKLSNKGSVKRDWLTVQKAHSYNRWIEEADAGSANAAFFLARVFELGVGTDPDPVASARWYRVAVEAGHPTSMNNLATAYLNGTGVPQDPAKAMELYQQAAGHGLLLAQRNIGVLYEQGAGVRQDSAEALRWWLKAAEAGDSVAQGYAGTAYERGRGTQKSYSKALEWFVKSAEAGESVSQYKAGEYYENGLGVARDLEEAKRWYALAKENGNWAAAAKLRRLSGE